MKRHLHNLFFPHHGNNHRAKILHHKSLSKLVLLILFFQLLISGISQVKPGVLGYASNISVGDIVSMTNQKRAEAGLPALEFNETLATSARYKAAHMFANNYWAHTAPDGTSPWSFFKQAGYTYLYAGENLARDFNDSGAVVAAWMESQTHKDNIMSGRYTQIGVAVVNGLLNGQETTLVVQHFGAPSTAVAAIPEQAAAESVQGVQIEPQVKPITEEPVVAVAEPVDEVVEDIKEVKQQEPANTQIKTLFPETLLESVSLDHIPAFSSFDLTKSVNLALTLIIIVVLVIDGILIWHRGTIRRTGKSFVHLSLFVMVALIIILTGSGRIL
ncbi:hypothetical protein GYA49_05510 [Candidatus Beckwithbacteria bacterium]|nr:hypothetical protein [Candidatus Beckwithbacteria bacterium]